jgi:uncharacterized protein YjbI with pentapeptide repeats
MVTRQLPWPGPRPYTDELSGVFRGRDKERTRLLTQLQGQRLSLMTASSGAGKTSLLQAGVIPQIREYRLKERRKAPGKLPTTPFPMLLNQWLERAGKGEKLDYAHLLTLEMHRYLKLSLDWYQRRAASLRVGDTLLSSIEEEQTAILQATAAVADYACAEGFAVRSSDAPLADLAWNSDTPECAEEECADRTTDRLLEVIDVISTHLGEILLVLDQFEEILLDWKLGQQALDAVESVFLLRRSNVRQLISMRHDGLHLLDHLEAKGLLENRRRVKIEPLSHVAVEQIIREVSRDAGQDWDNEPGSSGETLLERLVGAFTYATTGGGTRAGEVNLVGLQVVLNGVFRKRAGGNAGITGQDVVDYSESLESGSGVQRTLEYWLEQGHLSHIAPRSWIVQCLDGSIEDGPHSTDSAVFELQVQPLAARMSWLLVTPAGNKRTMTGRELHEYAYAEQAESLELEDLAGIAAERNWSIEDYLGAMRATCDEALTRLTMGNVLKRRGSETGEDIAYELVHDQFGKPFQAWADAFEATPEFDLNALQAVKSRLFLWSGALRPHDDDGVIPFARWEDCTLRNVDLSDLRFEHCDFGESLFRGCKFDDVHFIDCDFTNVTFRGCSFNRVLFERCSLASSNWIKGTSLELVRFLGGEESSTGDGMSFVQMRGATLKNCSFASLAGLKDQFDAELLLPMRYVQFVDCRFEGDTSFMQCRVDGGTLRGFDSPSRIDGGVRFDGCRMASFEISHVDVRGAQLQVHDCDCRGATFDRIDGGRDDDGMLADVDFRDVTLVGATMTGCTLEDVSFVGRTSTSDDPERSDASTFVISDRPAERRSERVPSNIADITFKDLDAENMSMERCNIRGDVRFENCMLSGATFLGDPGVQDKLGTRHVEGRLIFEKGCDLSAAEFNGLSFSNEHPLRISDCTAGAALFHDVSMSGSGPAALAAVIERSDLSGASLLGCALRWVSFCGTSDDDGKALTPMPTMTVKPHVKRGLTLPAVLSRVRFENIAMPGFVFQEISIEDDVAFEGCDLGGGTIGRLDRNCSDRLEATGDLHFADCRMDAIEMSFLQFTDESIRIRNCDCKSALFQEIGFDLESNREDGLLVDSSDMSGVLFLDCQITRARFSGKSSRKLSKAVTMTFRETKGDRADLGHTTIENYILDGGTLEGLAILGALEIRNCSLLRTKFEDLEFLGDAYIDITSSDLLYAQVDPRLVSDEVHFRMTQEQRDAAACQLEHESLLKLQAIAEKQM